MSYYRKLVIFVFSIMFVGVFVISGSQAFADDYYNDNNNIIVNDEIESNSVDEIVDDDTVRLLVSLDGHGYDDIQRILSEGVSECCGISVDSIDIVEIDDMNFVCIIRDASGIISVDDSIQKLSEMFPDWLISEDKVCVPAQDIPNDCPSPRYWSNYQAPFIRTGISGMYSLYSMPSVSSKLHDVEVAVFDTGFGINDDIKDKIDWKNSFKLTGNGWSKNSYEPLKEEDLNKYKTSGHSTHGETVSTVLAGKSNNNKFSSGFSVSDKIKIILVVPPIRNDKNNVLWYDSDFNRAIEILLKKKASGECPNLRVINISWSSNASVSKVRGYYNSNTRLPSFVESYKKAYENNVITVCAEGNDERIDKPYTDTGNTTLPASYPYTLSVNGLKDNGNIKYQYDEFSTISAIAENILTCCQNELRVVEGSSHAAPQVAGALASVFSQNPNLPVDKAIELLKSTANPLKQQKRGNGSAGELSISNLLNKTRTSALQTIINNELTKKKNNTPVSVHRVYNPNSGEHFYTLSATEKDSLVRVGWKYEGIAWKTVTRSNTPVYRVYNPNSGKHHYTMSVNERDSLIRLGWHNEGTSWYAPSNKTQTPVYRVYNPHSGEHHYTISTNERNVLIKAGWNNENIAWYAV